MEMKLSVLVSVSTLILISMMLRALYYIWWKPKMMERCFNKQGIRALPYRLLIGNLKEMVEMGKEAASKPTQFRHDIIPCADPLFQKTMRSYGKLFAVWFGPVPQLIVMEPELIKEILTNKSGDFAKPELNAFTMLFTSGLANLDGPKWAKHRKIINPAFHIDKLKRMLPIFSVCCEEMIGKWLKLVPSEGSHELDVFREFDSLAADVVSRAAFGSNYKESREIFELQKEQGLLFSHSYYMTSFPALRFLPWKSNARMREVYREVRALAEGIIEKRKEAIKTGNYTKDDLLQCLLDSHQTEIENKGRGLTVEDVIEEVKMFYFAGQETVANLLTWTIVTLSVHSDWQDLAREEVLRVVGKRKPTFDELTQLKIVTMILQEVLRLYPPTSLIRGTFRETKLGEYVLPEGVQIVIPLHLLHRDPELFGKDVTEFNPRRFSEGFSKASKDNSYIPFGGGPRVCVGQVFAMLEIKMTMARLLQHFSFEISPTYSHAPCNSVTLQPLFGAQVNLRKL